MSRYEFQPPGWPHHYRFAIGWDDVIESYFAQIIDTSTDDADAGIVLWLGSEKRPFTTVDAMMKAIDDGMNGVLPSVRLTAELRRGLKTKTCRPIVNQIGIAPAGQAALEAEAETPVRPWRAWGTCDGYLETAALQAMMDGAATQYFRLEALHRSVQAAWRAEPGDERPQQIFQSLQQMGVVCHFLSSMADIPDILVSRQALEAFDAIRAKAARILDAESAHTLATVH